MSDQPHDTHQPRALDIRLTCGTDVGFAVWEGGQLVAAFKWRHQIAEWLFDRLAELPGEIEREQREMPPPPPDNVQDFPRVAQRPRTEPPRGRGFFGR